MNLCNHKIRRCSVHKTQSQREIGKRNTQSYAVATRLYTGTPKSLNSAESGYRVTCSTYTPMYSITQTYTNRTILYNLCTRALKRKPLPYTLSIKLRQIVDLSKLLYRSYCLVYPTSGTKCEGAFALPSRGSICTVMQCTSVRYSAVLTLFSVVFNCKS